MVYSHTQIAQYLSCPRRYRFRYLEGWREKDSRASMLFGRVFETALGAYFRREDPGEVLFKEWAAYREAPLDYGQHDNWDRMVQQGVQLLNRFAQDDRVRIRQPRQNLQIKFTRRLSYGNEFVAYVDAIGHLDGSRCLIDWKTTSTSYPEGPAGLLALDPQLLCYSWITGITDVALVVFVRKRFPEIQYLCTSISDDQRREYGELVDETVARIEASRFLPHSGIRFPQNGCTGCPCLGLCLGNQDLVDARLVRRPGASDLDWLDQLDY
jgi:hypothetical protein